MKHETNCLIGDLQENAGDTTGILAGLSFVAKDNIDVAGFNTTGGTAALADNMRGEDSAVVARLRTAGAWPAGKANMHELSLGVTSNNAFFGAVLNPRDSGHIAGGSSGGSAAACAAGLTDFALGTDTGGSVKIPAAHCGVYGFRPSSGAYPTEGVLGLSNSRDTVGVISADLETLRRADAVIRGETEAPARTSSAPRQLRLGVPRWHWQGSDPLVQKACEAELYRLQRLGHELVTVDETKLFERAAKIANTLVLWESSREIERYLREVASPVSLEDVIAGVTSPDVRAYFELLATEPVKQAEYDAARVAQAELRAEHRQQFEREQIDALVYPTVPFAAPLAGENEVMCGEAVVPVFETSVRNHEACSVIGSPAISTPVEVEALPVGLCWEGPRGADLELLAAVASSLNR